MNENFPQEVVCERLAFLLLDRIREVTILTILHHNADGLLSNERVKVADNEMTIDLRHDLDLEHRLVSGFFRQHADIDLLDHVRLVFDQLAGFIFRL